MPAQPQPAHTDVPRPGLLARAHAAVIHHFPPGQFARYLVVGVVNTVFGYGIYAAITAWLTPHIPLAYMVANILGALLNITFAYFNFKLFIFKTRGSYLREWFRCILVYSSSVIAGTIALPFVVLALHYFTPARVSAPYIAGALLTGANVLAGFIGHRNFSFARNERRPGDISHEPID
jgi:putative flippase GtrA